MNNLEKLQKVQLNILKQLIRICDEHNLRYYAIAGTTLGAVRHNGFIPWDDDIDVSMPREDYEKLQEIFSRNSIGDYELETIYTHENHETPIMKLTDKSVKLIPRRKTIEQKASNAYIDIASMDGLPDRKISRYFHVWLFLIKRKLFYVANFNVTAEINNKNKSPIKKLLVWLINKLKIYKLFDKKSIAASGDKMLKKHSFYTAKYCSPQLWGMYKTKAVFPTEYIGEGAFLPFEDIQIRVPANYSGYLSQLYGEDYMQMPPSEQRKPKHSTELIFNNE